jgi:2-phospho-L-lactate transferase/gluconeogenesis factor (CofD/UPF0052 family)
MTEGQVIALSGGVGGAKLVLGLSHVLPSDRLVVVRTPVTILIIMDFVSAPIRTQ